MYNFDNMFQGGNKQLPSIGNLGMGSNNPDMGGGFGSIIHGPQAPEEELSWIEKLMGGIQKFRNISPGNETSPYALAGQQSLSQQDATGISGLLAMGQYRANKPKPRERMDNINNRYIQGLMGG